MKKFSRRRGMITTQLSSYEVELLSSLVAQLIELVSEGEPEAYISPTPARTPSMSWSASLTRNKRATEEPQGPGAEAAVPDRVSARSGGGR